MNQLHDRKHDSRLQLLSDGPATSVRGAGGEHDHFFPRSFLRRDQVEVALVCAANVLCTILVVSANKVVFDRYRFTYAATLTFVHFVVTGTGLALAAGTGCFVPMRLEWRKVARLALFGAGFVVLTNLSLQYNSVSFYQLFKHLNTVGVVAIEWLAYRKPLARPLWLPVALLLLGVVVNTANDFKFNWVGFAYANGGVLVTSYYQIWAGSLQREMKCNPLQLQLYTAPLSALCILPTLPLLDDYRRTSAASIEHFQPTPTALAMILLSGVVALFVNVSIFLTIGRTSALTYNVLGHAKTTTLLLFDFMFFGRPLDLRNTVGVAVALAGVVLYTHVKLASASEPSADRPKSNA